MNSSYELIKNNDDTNINDEKKNEVQCDNRKNPEEINEKMSGMDQVNDMKNIGCSNDTTARTAANVDNRDIANANSGDAALQHTLVNEANTSTSALTSNHQYYNLQNLPNLIFQNHKTYFLIYAIISSLIILLNILYQNYNGNNIQEFPGILHTIIHNMNSKPISDIMVIPSINSSCPDDYSLMPLGIWSGFNDYCYCGHNFLTSPYTSGECSSKNINNGCITINSRPNQTYYTWRNVSFCVKYIHNVLSSISYCPYGYDYCHHGGCYSIDEGCPITNIDYDSSNSRLTYVKDGQSQPFIGLQISMNGLPCLENNRAPFHHLEYPPLSVLKPIGCQTIDPSGSVIMDAYDQITLMKDNGMSEILSVTKYQDTLKGSQANLVMMKKYNLGDSAFCKVLTSNCLSSLYNSIEDYLKSPFFSAFQITIGAYSWIFIFHHYFGKNKKQNARSPLTSRPLASSGPSASSGPLASSSGQSVSSSRQSTLPLLSQLTEDILFFYLKYLLFLLSHLSYSLYLTLRNIEIKNSLSTCFNELNHIVNDKCFDKSIDDSIAYFSDIWNDVIGNIIVFAFVDLIVNLIFIPIYVNCCYYTIKKERD